MPIHHFLDPGVSPSREQLTARRWLLLTVIAVCVIGAVWIAASEAPKQSNLFASFASLREDNLDRSLQLAAAAALGEREGTIIAMDPQTGRIRAVVNSGLAFEQNLPPGSTIKPFTALAAFRSGLIYEGSRAQCGEEYAHEEFHTVCSHPRDLAPFDPAEAIAYSCNYYFGKVGERLNPATFSATLSEFGFGRKSGINVERESPGILRQGSWRSQNAIGETDDFQATPLQIINAYSALVNGGHLFTPRIAVAKGFIPHRRSTIAIKQDERTLIVKGMRGAVRYGTAESAGLYSLPNYIFGKTGTATQINGFRTHGWFVGFASGLPEGPAQETELATKKVELAILVFLTRAHGSDAARLARTIFDEYVRVTGTWQRGDTKIAKNGNAATKENFPNPSLLPLDTSAVRVHLVREDEIQLVSLEDYVQGVVTGEAGTESELEALKAQAVASRTYAVKNLGRHHQEGYDFCSTTHCQRYLPAASNSAVFGSSAATAAVHLTKGEVLRDERNQVADSYFSASCGGATANIGTLWGVSAPPYLRGVRDEFCTNEAHHSWTDIISQKQLLKTLQSDQRTNVGHRLHNVTVMRRDASGRAESIAIEGDRRVTVKGWQFKIIVGRALGWHLLKSSRFEIARSQSDFVFRGSGFGHGLGLCQEGAHVMAARGATYRQILAKYFPGTSIARAGGWASSADLIWNAQSDLVTQPIEFVQRGSSRRAKAVRRVLASNEFRVSYPSSVSQSEVEQLLGFLRLSRSSLTARVAAAGLAAQFPVLEIYINDTTGDFVGRTGQPPWAAAATKDHRIELQPLETLKRRRILETTLRHELVHALVDVIGRGRAPRWLAEGLAIHFAGEARLVARHEPRRPLTTDTIEQRLMHAKSADEMRLAYAAAYGEVRRLINLEGEAKVWRRVAR